MLKGDCAYIAIGIKVQNRVVIKILGLGNSAVTLDVQSVGIREVLNFHGWYPRPENALCTVSGLATG
jgi:hypothetical protein